jgi:predicted AAA+ superfamily ATPase
MPLTDASVVEQNPWWADADAIKRDRHLERARAAPYEWSPPFLSRVAPAPDAVDTLRGPRQVGKTTACKTIVQRLLPETPRVLYYSLDLEREPAVIADLMRAARRLHPLPLGDWFVLLDEVTSIPDWQLGVKYAVDAGLLDRCYVLCTGSSAHRMGTEQLVGRRGGGRDFILLPLSFREFISAFGMTAPPAILPWELLSTQSRTALRQINLASADLASLLARYRRVGGFPYAVAALLNERTIGIETLQVVWAMIASDLATIGREPVAALAALRHMGRGLGSPLDWTALAEHMGVRSPHTAKDYALRLAEAFVLLIVYFWDPSRGALNPAKQRKVYFQDPLVARVPELMGVGVAIPEAGLNEGLVAQALYRSAIDDVVLAEPASGGLGCWRSTGGNEIDFTLATPKDRIGIEVKGDSSRGIASARRSIQRVFGAGFVVTDTVLDVDHDIPCVPLAVFLATAGDAPGRHPFLI